MFESKGIYYVKVYDNNTWHTHRFYDPESQRNFVVALGNCIDEYEEVFE